MATLIGIGIWVWVWVQTHLCFLLIPLQALMAPHQDTPPNLYSPFGLMPRQHVAFGAQTITLDIVQVGGRYWVGKLLGAGTFGMSIWMPSGPLYCTYITLFRNGLPGKRHQEGVRCSCETWGCPGMWLKARPRIQHLSGNFRNPWNSQDALVRDGRAI